MRPRRRAIRCSGTRTVAPVAIRLAAHRRLSRIPLVRSLWKLTRSIPSAAPGMTTQPTAGHRLLNPAASCCLAPELLASLACCDASCSETKNVRGLFLDRSEADRTASASAPYAKKDVDCPCDPSCKGLPRRLAESRLGGPPAECSHGKPGKIRYRRGPYANKAG